MFHSFQCPACQQIYPHFMQAANESAGFIRFGQIDTMAETVLNNRYHIVHIPVFYIFYPGAYTRFEDYPHAHSIIKAASARIPKLAKPVDETWIPNGSSKSAILFTDNPGCPPIWAGISCKFAESDVSIGITTRKDLRPLFNISSVPSILLINRDHYSYYRGNSTFTDVLNSLTEYFSDQSQSDL
jgi:hypothetical protein